MSARKLGGGRILGSGKGLAPPISHPTNKNGLHQRTSSLLSQSESTVSLGQVSNGSESSASPLTTSPLPEPQDLGSRVSLENQGGNGNGGGTSLNAAATGASKLVCPICNEEMMTLLQLNRHLDDNHQELPEVQQDEVKTWFDKQVQKAKRFQPLAAINQKIKGLDTFESNIIPPTPTMVPGNRTAHRDPTPPPDPDEVVDRRHWQKPSYNDACTEPSCAKRLGAVNGSVNCRKCGKLFCEDHTMYQMKLSRSAQHEPVRGLWCRVCETCYKSRDGYNDHNGLLRDDTSDFMAMRRKRVDKQYLEISRLEKRLTKLTQLLAVQIEAGLGNTNNPLSRVAASTERKQLEQSVVDWEDDSKVLRCPFCQQDFGSWTFRRHHCRICGRVVCADAQTGCSTEIGLNVASEKGPKEISVDVRMCRDCKSTIFSKKDFALSLSHKPPDLRAYENLLQFEQGIRKLLPSFHRLLQALQDPENPPSSATIAEASKIRKRLLDSFGKYDIAAKRIRDLPTGGSMSQEKLQKAIYMQASNFLHLHMLPLKTLPKILKHASPHGNGGRPHLHPHHANSGSGSNTPRGGALAAIKYNDIDSASQVSSSSAVSALEAEEKELKERLIVLEEQKFLVQEMIANASKRRKFDEVASLAVNVEDLSKEIDVVNGMIGQLDFEGVYGAMG